MANDKQTTSVSPKPVKAADNSGEGLTPKCSVCSQTFASVQECLKHELLLHSMQKKVSAKTGVEGRVKATIKYLNGKDKQEERTKVHQALQKCANGQELVSVFKLLCMNPEILGLIFTRIQTCLEKELRSLGVVKIYPFGSIASGLASRDSDIDIFLDASQIPVRDLNQPPSKQRRITGAADTRQSLQQRGAFNRINSLLQRSPLFVDVFAIRGARVPIIKCKHRDTGFSIDINISCPSSRENTQFICELVQSDLRIHELFVYIKLWAKNMQIIGRSNMTSYCLITMIIFYLQQPWKQMKLKSVRDLQRQCRPHMVQGINYAFDLLRPENKPKIPKSRKTFDLIKGFFQFYKDYNFEDNIISTYYGVTIAKKAFEAQQSKEYSRQLYTITQYCEGVPAEPLQVDRCMCVQDSFGLNHNVARTMLPPNKKYFVMCLENAHTICENLNNATMGETLEKLLYETVTRANLAQDKPDFLSALQKTDSAANDVNGNSESLNALNHIVAPSKSDLNHIANTDSDLTTPEAILRFWCEHYIEAIKNMLNDFYHIDMQTKSCAAQKQPRLENTDLSQSWLITASVDLWSHRFFQKPPQQTFREYQMAQTDRLHGLRRQDAKFAVQLNAVLTINVQSDYTGISVNVALPDGAPISSLGKKDPLRKFFNVFKNTIQNYNLKEAMLPAVDKTTPAQT